MSKIAYLVLHHNDFDGFLSACIFTLRGLSALGIDLEQTVFAQATYGTKANYSNLLKSLKEKLDASEVKLILLDFTLDPAANLDKIIPFLTIDHHARNPESEIVIHSPDSPSCAELIAKTFPVPNAKSNSKNMKLALTAAHHIDTGGSLADVATLHGVLKSVPGCLSLHLDSFSHKFALSMLNNFLKNELTEEEVKEFDRLVKQNTRLLEFKTKPFKVYSVGVDSFAWYKFGSSRLENLRYKIALTYAITEFDYVVVSVENRNLSDGLITTHCSFRTKHSDFNIDNFCKLYGGGGRKTGAGGFDIKSEFSEEYSNGVAIALGFEIKRVTKCLPEKQQ